MIFKKKRGTHGRIEIPSLLIGIPLYDGDGKTAQDIVDAPQSAVFLRWRTQDVIADHSFQDGFQRLRWAVPGKTVAYIDNDGREAYICVQKQVGHIRDKLYDSQWQEAKPGGLVMYTCIGESDPDTMDVWLTYWKKQKE